VTSANQVQRDGTARTAVLNYLSLFTSFGTLLCCALPSLLVLAGMGATVAGVLSAVPWLVTVSRHKNWVFTVSGVLIAFNFFYTYALAPRLRARGGACPVDAPQGCDAATTMSRVILWISAGIYSVGFFTAYLLGPLLMRFGE
jgi:mercuric ion transport protein